MARYIARPLSTITKNRTRFGFEKLKFNGKKHGCLKFKGDYEIKSSETGQSYDYYQYSYYAKNIGMIMYERFYPDRKVKLELTKTYNESEWNKLMKKLYLTAYIR